MRLTITPTILFVAVFLAIVWIYRYEHVTRQMEDVSCVERVNRYTKARCLVSGNEPVCRKVISSPPC